MVEKPQRGSRVLVIGLVATTGVLALALVLQIIATSGPGESSVGRVDVLENSDDPCVSCHRRQSPGIVEQYGHSSMAAAEVTCSDCHVVDEGYPGSERHEGANVLARPTTAVCERCHESEAAQFNHSRHGLPAFVAYNGTEGLSAEHLELYESISEGGSGPDRARNALFEMEGPEVTRFACRSCHDVGRPAEDGSVGQCTSCHLRHEFSLEQVRRPETCNHCHIGPDHPQWEIYQESSHGIAYATGGQHWHWDAEPGTLTTADFPAPTCATCHFSGFGASGTTHDTGDRLSWYLFAPISERRPTWQENQVRMQNVCSECHSSGFIDEFYTAADAATLRVNRWVEEGREIMRPLRDNDLLTPEPFDQPIDFVAFELWHHWGRTAKFGVWMQGADYVQWHGAYEILSDLAELREMTAEMLLAAGLEQPADDTEAPAADPNDETSAP